MRIAIYVRVSTQRQAQAQTIEQQIDRLRAHLQAQGWPLPEGDIFRDDGYSGASLKRPGLDRLRDRAAMASFDKILITDPDRLARNYVHQVLLLEELQKTRLPRRVPRPADVPGPARPAPAPDPRGGRRV